MGGSPFTHSPKTTMATGITIFDKVNLFLGVHGLQVNETIRVKYYQKQKHAIHRITNSQTRPAKNFTQSNDGTDRVILEAAINVAATIKETIGIGFDLHHMEAYSKGGSSNIRNLRLIPSCINHLIGDSEFTEEEINDLCERLKGSAVGRQIPDWFRCCPLAEFIQLVSENTAN
jgi:hypothetical protein